MRRNSGARGLRAILENTMLDVMYEIPSQPAIKEVLISEEVVTKREQPIVVLTHRPLMALYPQWDWATRDGQAAIDLLMPSDNVTAIFCAPSTT